MNPFDVKSALLARHAQHVVLVHFPDRADDHGDRFRVARGLDTRATEQGAIQHGVLEFDGRGRDFGGGRRDGLACLAVAARWSAPQRNAVATCFVRRRQRRRDSVALVAASSSGRSIGHLTRPPISCAHSDRPGHHCDDRTPRRVCQRRQLGQQLTEGWLLSAPVRQDQDGYRWTRLTPPPDAACRPPFAIAS